MVKLGPNKAASCLRGNSAMYLVLTKAFEGGTTLQRPSKEKPITEHFYTAFRGEVDVIGIIGVIGAS